MVPIAVTGVWLWFSDSAGNYLNGFQKLIGDDRTRAANLEGLGIVLGSYVMSVGLALLVSNGNMFGILLIVLSVVFILIPIAFFNEKIRKIRIPFRDSTPAVKAVLALLISVTVIIPIPIACIMDQDGNDVTVTFGGDSFTVRAPSFDHTFRYEDVKELTFEENFEKGRRVYGFATSKISSGKYSNSSFGDYYLASYSKVSPCITFSADGTMYAFNQIDDEKTEQAFDTLYEKVKAYSS